MTGKLLRLAPPLLSFIASALLFSALGEQIIWNGERSALTAIAMSLIGLAIIMRALYGAFPHSSGTPLHTRWAPPVLTGAALFLHALNSPPLWPHGLILAALIMSVSASRGKGSPLDAWLISIFGAAITFGALSNFHQSFHLVLSGEPDDGIFYSLCFSTIALAALWYKAFRQAHGMAVAVAGIYFLLSAFAFFFFPLDPRITAGDRSLYVTLILLGSLHFVTYPRANSWTSYFDHASRAFGTALFLGLAAIVISAYMKERRPSCASTDAYEIPSYFLVSLLVAEDPIFTHHLGIDFHRVRQAIRETIETRRYGRGGSTIPMQLAKVCYLNQNKNIIRKAQQIVLGTTLSVIRSRAEVLYEYLESIPLAPGITGLTAAAAHFYGTAPRDLSESQALELILSIYDPSHYHPQLKPIPGDVNLRRAVIAARSHAYCPLLLRDLMGIEGLKIRPHKCR